MPDSGEEDWYENDTLDEFRSEGGEPPVVVPEPELGADGDDWKEEMEEEWPDEGQDAGHWEDDWNGGEQVPVCSANGG